MVKISGIRRFRALLGPEINIGGNGDFTAIGNLDAFVGDGSLRSSGGSEEHEPGGDRFLNRRWLFNIELDVLHNSKRAE